VNSEFRAKRHIATTPEAAFEFVSDYRHVPHVLEGVTRWEPLTERATGRGARFDVEMSTLGIPLSGILVLDQWQPPHRIGWRSESGLIQQTGRWSFQPEDGGTSVELAISYQPPGAAVGSLLATGVRGLVSRRLELALERMAQLLEATAEVSAPRRAPRRRRPPL
jgi:ribosome-associated toxin RatA of RatAB toxin-antitoxin module